MCKVGACGGCDLVVSQAPYICWGLSGTEYIHVLHSKEKESSQVSVIQGDPSLPASCLVTDIEAVKSLIKGRDRAGLGCKRPVTPSLSIRKLKSALLL